MPTLVLPDVPADLYERLERSAAGHDRRPADEAIAVLKQSFAVSPAAKVPPPMPPGETEDDYPSVGMLPLPKPVRPVAPHRTAYRTPTPPVIRGDDAP